jgi:hypothetical protein
MKIAFLMIGCGALLGPVVAAIAQPPFPGSRSLQTSGRFVDTTVGFWEMREEPELIRKPSLPELAKADPKNAAADFGLSFNCAVKSSGALADCRPIYASPDTADKAALAHSLARYIRVSPASSRLAREKAYRLTIDVALDTIDRYGGPTECRPPFCMIEGATPPPPPPPLQDPVIAATLNRARKCFDTAWQRSGELRSAAEKALRDRAGQPAMDADRMLVLDYVNSRHALAACISTLRATARVLPLGGSDRKAVAAAIDGMKMSYDGQARYERIILIGLLDPSAAKTEAAIP